MLKETFCHVAVHMVSVSVKKLSLKNRVIVNTQATTIQCNLGITHHSSIISFPLGQRVDIEWYEQSIQELIRQHIIQSINVDQ